MIDYFHDMSLLKEGDGVNFQKASCTLDGCVKIYTSRVDSVATETGKLLNGLTDNDGKKRRGVEDDRQDGEAGLFSYLSLYYCRLPHLPAVVFVILTVWLGLLFTTIGIAASDFFCVNLSTISTILGMSESLAGVTFLAFGNGSPDVFSTFAAMNSHSGSLAIGELIGAASFITAVVAGAMAIVQPFQVARNTFVRDLGFFIVAVAFSMGFLADGTLRIWECAVMVGYYVFYVAFVVIWHWWIVRRRSWRTRNSELVDQYFDLETENPTEEQQVMRDGDLVRGERQSLLRHASMDNVQPFDYGRASPRIHVADGEDEEDACDKLLAEVNSNMRLTRPPRGDRRHSINPIRPSLVGALEFRAVLSSLQRSQSHVQNPSRRHSYNESDMGGQQSDQRSFVSGPEVRSQSGRSIDEGYRYNSPAHASSLHAADPRASRARARVIDMRKALPPHLGSSLGQRRIYPRHRELVCTAILQHNSSRQHTSE